MAQHALDREPIDNTAAPAAAGDAACADGRAPEAPQDRREIDRESKTAESKTAESKTTESKTTESKTTESKTTSERSCIVSREKLSPAELIRFVLSPDSVVTPDIRRSLPGRGVWVTASRALILEACKRKAFARAFRKEVTVPNDLADQVGELLRKDALQAISLANKAGAVKAGFEKVRAALAAGEVLALIEARDGSPEGRKKLTGALRADRPPADARSSDAGAIGRPALVDCFASGELDLALGRPHVIHAALLKVPVSGFALTKCLRFHRFELSEKPASGGAERCGAAQSDRHLNRRIEPQDRSLHE